MDPTPNDRIAHTLPISLSNPNIGKIGKMMEEVVIIAIVDDPCAVLSKAAIQNGIKIPRNN